MGNVCLHISISFRNTELLKSLLYKRFSCQFLSSFLSTTASSARSPKIPSNRCNEESNFKILRQPTNVMHFSTLLFPLAAALPIVLAHPLTDNHGSSASCVSQKWSISGFTTYDAATGPVQPGTPELFQSSHLSFRFDDPNTNISTICRRELEAGAGGTMADAHHQYPCNDASVQYVFDGKYLVVSHKFRCNR